MTPAQRIAILRSTVGGSAPPVLVTLDPAKKGGSLTLDATKLIVSTPTGSWQSVLATIPAGAGKRYFEVLMLNFNNSSVYCGFGCGSASMNVGNYLGADGFAMGVFSGGDTRDKGGGIGSFSPGAFSVGGSDIGQGVIDVASGKFWGGRNNVYDGNPVTGTGGFTLPAGPIFAGIDLYENPAAAVINFGATAFTYGPPAGCVPYNAA